jgi:hypothetical protein
VNASRQSGFVSFEAIDVALCTVLLLCGLDLVGQLVVRIPIDFVRNLLPQGVESPFFQHMLAGFVVMLIGGLLIVVYMLRRELREETTQRPIPKPRQTPTSSRLKRR